MQIQDSTTEREKTATFSTGRKSRVRVAAFALLAIAGLLAIGFLPRLLRRSEAKEIAQQASGHVPAVFTIAAKSAGPTDELTLPGNIEARYVASLYARSNGYVKRRLVDIGTRVHTGQLLAEIEAPEIDQQLAQARAALSQTKAAYEQSKANFYESQASVSAAKAGLEQANANQEIAKTTDRRWTRLVDRGVIPRQQGDEKRSIYQARVAEVSAAQANIQTAQATVVARQASIEAAQANIAAAEADVQRLREMVAFERVVAPFDGIITERRVERGDLVTAGSGGPQSHLFSIAQADILRIQVQVPQAYASDIEDGQSAEVDVRGSRAQSVTGKVARSANALNSQSRTLLAEVQVDNQAGLLFPGMYADVKFVLRRKKNLIIVPADTLVVNASGPRVVLAASDGKVHYQPIQIGRDLGGEVEVLDGLKGGERLISNPTDALTEGQQVEVRTAPASQQGKA